jgi:hypothetical protein
VQESLQELCRAQKEGRSGPECKTEGTNGRMQERGGSGAGGKRAEVVPVQDRGGSGAGCKTEWCSGVGRIKAGESGAGCKKAEGVV